MANFEIRLPIRKYNSKEAEEVIRFFDDIELSWMFCQKEAKFVTNATINEKKGNTYKHEIMGIKKLLEWFPDKKSLKNDLAKYEEKEKADKLYDIVVTFNGEIAAEIDIEHNSILHYTGPIVDNLSYCDLDKVKKLIHSDSLEEFYEEKVKRFLICIMMCCVITYPGGDFGCGRMELWIDNKKYRSDTFLEYPLYVEAYRKHSNLMTTKLNFMDAFSWIREYTKLEENEKKPPVPFTMLTYLLNRDNHESLLYSVIGLENLYTSNRGGISYTLQRRINYFFPAITKEQIKDIYKQRSYFVHGNKKLNMYKDYSGVMNGEIECDDEAMLACALLIETIRILAVNKATKISFEESLTHKFV